MTASFARPYTAVLGARFRMLLQYRAAALAGLATQIFWGLIRMMIFQAFYTNTAGPQPMALADVVTYVWLGQAMLVLLPYRADGELAQLIRSGGVAYELLRPVGLYGLWYARAIADRTAPAVLRAVPMLIMATLLGWLRWPGPIQLAAFLASLSAAVLLVASITMLMNLSLFWTISGRGVSAMFSAVLFLLSGHMVPLPLFPDWAKTVLYALPFRGVIDVPFRLFTEDIPAADLPRLLAFQLAWTFVLVLVGRILLRRAMRRVIVQGG